MLIRLDCGGREKGTSGRRGVRVARGGGPAQVRDLGVGRGRRKRDRGGGRVRRRWPIIASVGGRRDLISCGERCRGGDAVGVQVAAGSVQGGESFVGVVGVPPDGCFARGPGVENAYGATACDCIVPCGGGRGCWGRKGKRRGGR